MKQEERVLLFEKLSYALKLLHLIISHLCSSRKTQAQIPSALNLQSSSTLGTGYVKTHQERLDRDEDKEVRYAMDGRNQKGKGKRKRGNQVFNSGATDESDVDDGMKVIPEDAERDEELGSEGEDYEGRTRSNPVVLVDSGFSTSEVTSQQKITKIEVGSALQRNADGTVVGPRISRRKLKGTQVGCALIRRPSTTNVAL